jgi:programmed cell death protein 5
MDELDEIRKRKLMELQRKLEEEKLKEEQRVQQELQIRALLKQILTPEARARLANIRLANPSYASQIEALLIQLAQTGRITQKINDEQLKLILSKIGKKKRDFRIIRK